MSSWLSDFLFTLRLVRRDKWFAFATVTWLALGIASVTTLFSLLNAVLKPLPYPNAHEIVMLRSLNRSLNLPRDSVSAPDFRDIRLQSTTLVDIVGFLLSRLDVPTDGGYQRLRGFFVTPGFFKTLRTPPLLGVPFADARTTGVQREVIISAKLWRERFEGQSDVLGRTLLANSWATFPNPGSRAYTVSCVLPEDFRCLPAAIFFEPTGVGPADQLDFCSPLDMSRKLDRQWRDMEVIARLKPGVTLQEAQADMDLISGRLEQTYGSSNEGWTIDVVPLHEEVFGNVGPMLTVMFAAAIAVMLIACGNVGQLYLQRASRREAEFAVRAAMGASPFRLFRQLATETLLLILFAGSLGVALASVAIDALAANAPQNLPWLGEVPIDGGVLVFAATVTLISVLLVSLVPLWRVATPDLNRLLGSGRTASGGTGESRVSNILLVSQLAVTFVLIAGAGVLFARFYELSETDPGFESSNRLSMTLSLPQATHEWNYNSTFCNRVLERVAALPGVRGTAAIQGLPIDGTTFECRVIAEGKPTIGRGEARGLIRVISDNYFHTMGIPLLRGRAFNPTDSIGQIGGNRTVIVNESLANRNWPDQDPIGRRFKVHPLAHWMEIVGVVADIRNGGMDASITSDIYYPEKLYPQPHITLITRTDSDPISLADTVSDAVHEVDADAYITDVTTVDGVISESIAQRRYFMVLLGILATVAMVLAIGGAIVTTLHSVSRRSRELGTRIALGAEPHHVFVLVMKRSLSLLILGLATGGLAAFAVVPPLVTDWDSGSGVQVIAFAAAPLILGTVSVIAAGAAAARASRMQPATALRAG